MIRPTFAYQHRIEEARTAAAIYRALRSSPDTAWPEAHARRVAYWRAQVSLRARDAAAIRRLRR